MPKTKDKNHAFSQAMIAWYKKAGRKNLPWQLDNSPYHTWISEIMLQQTQVKTVIPYYRRFTEHFPSVQDLANAPIDEVLHLWTGLGYYTRARNLHRCSEILWNDYQGQFPKSLEELEQLPGIGRSTAGAILSLSMNISAPILDGNVKRVFSRFFCVEGWSGSSVTQKKLWQLAETLLPEKQVKAYNQSLMDLGATICKRGKPLCEVCPLAPQCQSYQNNVQHLYPQPKPKKTLPEKSCYMLVLQQKNKSVLLEQRPAQGIWGGLWSLPEFQDNKALKQFCKKLGYATATQKQLKPIKHTFSHFHLHIQPVLCKVEGEPDRIHQINEPKQTLWYLPEQSTIGLASPIKKLLESIQT